jgi:hypothetical protein
VQSPTPTRSQAGLAAALPERSRPPESTLRRSLAPVSLEGLDCEGGVVMEGHLEGTSGEGERD